MLREWPVSEITEVPDPQKKAQEMLWRQAILILTPRCRNFRVCPSECLPSGNRNGTRQVVTLSRQRQRSG
jgi:hypothetical protein